MHSNPSVDKFLPSGRLSAKAGAVGAARAIELDRAQTTARLCSFDLKVHDVSCSACMTTDVVDVVPVRDSLLTIGTDPEINPSTT